MRKPFLIFNENQNRAIPLTVIIILNVIFLYNRKLDKKK